MFLVYPQLPRAGLGNMLLVWARAVLFADINSIPVVAPSWGQIRIGTYLRGEREKRYYGNLFCNKNYLSKINYAFGVLNRKSVIHNPPISKLNLSDLELKGIGYYLFVFDSLPHWSDYFIDLKECQPFIKQRLLLSIRSSVLKTIDNRPVPQIGIHIRMGDFKVLKPGDDFTKLGNVRTPMTWYVRVIDAIRKIAGYDVPVTLFSDGHDRELCELLNLPQVSRSPSDSALSDMVTLSRSKLLITSSGSTFSGWASYLGQCPTIWHPAHFHAGVFSHDISQTVFEGGFDPELMTVPDLLIDNIRAAF
jgi:hypothetical protein